MKLRHVWFGIVLFSSVALHPQDPPAWTIGPLARPKTGNPVIAPRPESVFEDPILKAPARWEALHTFNPAAIVRDNKVYVLYRAEDDSGKMQIGMHTSRLGLAESSDGIRFTRRKEPVFYAANDDQKPRESLGGVEDPRLVESEDGTYVLTYTQWNHETYTIGIATSRDLEHWTKYGPAFLSAAGGKYAQLQYKSAGIVTRFDPAKNRLIAAKIHGKYWMYWGEISVRLATSPDLIHWTPVEDVSGAPVELLHKRSGLYDSGFPEVGAPAVLTDRGIVLIYNGKNANSGGDPHIDNGSYSIGEALFDADDPGRLLDQTHDPVFQPELPYERTGQYVAGTTFAEGLVLFQSKWFLYYGCADSFVAVATAPVSQASLRR